jgi:hypothetical protein
MLVEVGMWGGGERGEYVAAEDQVVDYAHYSAHCCFHAAFAFVWTRELDCLAISEEAAGEKLVVYVERRGAQIVRFHIDF